MVGGSVSLAVVGATGAVGREMLAYLEQHRVPHGPIRLFASARSGGATLPYRGASLPVEVLGDDSLDAIDVALLSAGSSVSKQVSPRAAERGCVVIDNSSAFRMTPGVPLVIPEVNPGALGLESRRSSGARLGGRIIANPNCSVIILLMGLTPLHRAFGVERIVVSTYQAASGAGAAGMAELESQTRAVLAGREAERGMFPEPYAFNLFSHNAAMDPVTGLNVEEQKMIDETRKIWDDPGVRISATCVRVPVMRAHSESVNVTLREPATVTQVREAIGRFPGVRLVDDRAGNRFPTPLKAAGGDDVLVGRIRADPSQLPRGGSAESATRGFDLFLAGDQLRKGAAQNAVQIMRLLTGA